MSCFLIFFIIIVSYTWMTSSIKFCYIIIIILLLKLVHSNLKNLVACCSGRSSCCSESQREAALLLGQFAATDSDCKVDGSISIS